MKLLNTKSSRLQQGALSQDGPLSIQSEGIRQGPKGTEPGRRLTLHGTFRVLGNCVEGA